MIRLKDFPSLSEELQSTFEEHSALAIAESVGFKIFETSETDQLNYLHQILHGVKGIKEIADGQNYPRVSTEQGDDITYTQRQFGVTIPVTKKMRKFDMYAKIKGIVQSEVDDAWDGIDQSLADVFLNGWDTSYTDVWGTAVAAVGPDGLALFSASHTNGATAQTYSNIISDGTNTNPALSRAAIVKTIKAARVYKDANNQTRPIRIDTLIVSPENEDEAYRIVFSEKLSGGAFNDTNEMMKRIKNIIVWERLDQTSAGTDTSAYWFLVDSTKAKETLKCLFSERPSLDAPSEVYENKDWEWTLDFFYTVGIGFAAFVYGSKGDNS